MTGTSIIVSNFPDSSNTYIVEHINVEPNYDNYKESTTKSTMNYYKLVGDELKLIYSSDRWVSPLKWDIFIDYNTNTLIKASTGETYEFPTQEYELELVQNPYCEEFPSDGIFIKDDRDNVYAVDEELNVSYAQAYHTFIQQHKNSDKPEYRCGYKIKYIINDEPVNGSYAALTFVDEKQNQLPITFTAGDEFYSDGFALVKNVSGSPAVINKYGNILFYTQVEIGTFSNEYCSLSRY